MVRRPGLKGFSIDSCCKKRKEENSFASQTGSKRDSSSEQVF